MIGIVLINMILKKFGINIINTDENAVAAFVENGGFGATWAAPIASLLTEKYLTGAIRPERRYLEDRVLEGNLLHKVKVKK